MKDAGYHCLKCDGPIRHGDAILLPSRFDETAVEPENDFNSGWMAHARCLGLDENDLDLPDVEDMAAR